MTTKDSQKTPTDTQINPWKQLIYMHVFRKYNALAIEMQCIYPGFMHITCSGCMTSTLLGAHVRWSDPHAPSVLNEASQLSYLSSCGEVTSQCSATP